MRTFVIPCLALTAWLASPAAADVIRLKSGDVIYADQVKETGDNVEYTVEDNTYRIPKSRVASVEAESGAPSRTEPLPIPALSSSAEGAPIGNQAELLNQIVIDHQVNREVLETIEARRDDHATAIAYYIAGKSEYESGKLPDARNDLETALRYNPRNPAVLNYYAAILVRSGSALDAISYAERALAIAPDSADAYAVLGYAQFSAARLSDAIESWRKSLALRPDAAIQQLLERAEREVKAERNFSERETGHFVLRYEGHQISDSFRDQVLAVLESDYQGLRGEFGASPHSAVQVVVYTNQAFFDVTRAPAWMGAINDGVVRVPVEGLESVTPGLARVLRHELTHSFVNQLTLARCPEWLNEGIAQALEPQVLGSRAAGLGLLYRDDHEIHLNLLEGEFSSLSSAEAKLAYDESLAAVQFIREQYGMRDLIRVLEQLGRGESVEASLRSVLHTDYGRLEDELRTYVLRLSGN